MKITSLFHNSCLAIGLSVGGSLCAQTYTTQIINPPPGTSACVGDAMNNVGMVVGRTTITTGSRKKQTTVSGPGFLWSNGASFLLPPLTGQPYAEAYAVSDAGLAVGGGNLLYTPLEGDRAAWWADTGSGYQPHDWNDLVPLDWNVTLLRALSISADGQYAAFSADVGGTVLRDIIVHVQLDESGMSPQALEEYWDVTVVWGINQVCHVGADSVLATGVYPLDSSHSGAFLWIKEGNNDPILIDRHSSTDAETVSWSVNSSGEMAGYRRNSGVDRAVVWNLAGDVQDIGTLGGAEAMAQAINDAGTVVGWSDNGRKGRSGGQRAFLWDGVSMVDLNTQIVSGLTLTQGRAINDAGQILCWSSSGSVLLTPQ